MNKRNWKILYTDYVGMQKRAIELVNKEMGRQLIRDKGLYVLHVLTCEKTEEIPKTMNAVVIGRYESNKLIQKFIKKEEIQENGYVVKVMDNPINTELKLVIITGETEASVYYGAVDFVDDYFAFAAPIHGGIRMTEEIFEQKKMPDYYNASAPKFKTRSIFTWGHPINNYRAYIENMARLKLNQIIIWNDFVPINADDIVDYAHEYGIEVIWGFAWGWIAGCGIGDYLKNIMNDLPALKKQVIDGYQKKYSNIKGDGIYFQSFTEVSRETEDGKIVAEIVTQFVNETADELLKLYPDLRIQFGLHATGVKEKIKYIAKVDKRIEILWEDCGAFPYHYVPSFLTDEEFDRTLKFTEDIIKLREVNPIGLVYKGQMTMDWERWVSQSGPYIMGCESEEIIENDRAAVKPLWRVFQAEWIKYGKYAYKMTNKIYELTGGNVNMNMAGALAGGIWFPTAIAAQLFWDCTGDYEKMVEKVAKRHSVLMA